ncbi:MAG: hypothetical protein LBU14_04165 [Candidatus Peribacteria bacterium]|nr:hypothetical protein [Candidatus Peribacteria bacterium]
MYFLELVQYIIIFLSLWVNSPYFLYKSILFAFDTSLMREKNISPQKPKAMTAHSSNVRLKFTTLSSRNTFLTPNQWQLGQAH